MFLTHYIFLDQSLSRFGEIQNGFFMHIVPDRNSYRGIFHCQTLQGNSSVTNGNPVCLDPWH